MNWLTWRQYRFQAMAGYAAIAVLAALFLVVGMSVLDVYKDLGIDSCRPVGSEECFELARGLSDRFSGMMYLLPLFLLAPALFGMFWGAPLVARELENGTHRLAWTQSITRGRWITSKLAIILASSAVAAGILALTMTWWAGPFVKSGNWVRLEWGNFDLQGIVPIAYTVFAVALGVALGAMFRKTLPAVFATLPIFFAVRIPIMLIAREHYMGAKTTTEGFKFSNVATELGPGDWIINSQLVDGTGAPFGSYGGFDFADLAARCPGIAPAGKGAGDDAVMSCLDRIGVHTLQTYHPAGRFWAFQAIESAIFLGLAALLVVYIVSRVKKLS